jgi:hypothetical protein
MRTDQRTTFTERTANPARSAADDIGSPSVVGEAAAALLASGIGCFAVGAMATLSEASASLSDSLKFVAPVGPLSGKTTVAVAFWLLAWGALHLRWRGRELAFGPIIVVTFALIVLGVLGTFPPFFDLFASD